MSDKARWASLREDIFQEAVRRGPDGAIAEELYLVFPTSQNTGTMRCSELKFAGRLIETGRKRHTKAHRPASILIAAQFKDEATFICDTCKRPFKLIDGGSVTEIVQQPYIARDCGGPHEAGNEPEAETETEKG